MLSKLNAIHLWGIKEILAIKAVMMMAMAKCQLKVLDIS
jgi:hypothetical protein